VTRLARNMVTRLGMSPDLGPLVYGQKEELIFLGREISEQRDYSETVAERIDTAVRALVEESFARAKRILNDHRPQLDNIARRLIEVETIDGEEFGKSLAGSPAQGERHAGAAASGRPGVVVSGQWSVVGVTSRNRVSLRNPVSC
jgi:ATP-dependent Zn protease